MKLWQNNETIRREEETQVPNQMSSFGKVLYKIDLAIKTDRFAVRVLSEGSV